MVLGSSYEFFFSVSLVSFAGEEGSLAGDEASLAGDGAFSLDSGTSSDWSGTLTSTDLAPSEVGVVGLASAALALTYTIEVKYFEN